MIEKVKDFVDGVKETSPRETIPNVVGVADRATTEAKHYVQSTTIPGFVDDVTRLIARYPVQSLIIGTMLGFLLLRKLGNSDEGF